MRPLNPWIVLGVTLAFFAVGILAAASVVATGKGPLLLTPWIGVLFAVVGVWLLVAGHAVRKLKKREATWISPLQAARVAIFARSSAPVSGAFAGFAAGVAVVGFMRAWAPAMLTSGWTALITFAGATFAAVAAIVAERWCLDDQGDDREGSTGRRRDMGPATFGQHGMTSHD